MINYDSIKEGTFNHSTFIEDSILDYLDISIDEDIECEEELLHNTGLVELVDIVNYNKEEIL